ncbi:MAG: U32 family peptidase [Lachnospiraceae bacterium]|nr:U32 family peptidase [Lachnospiraceae bacterium]
MSGALDNRIELLSPAGDLKCFYAAINAGADAVYAGLDKFGARAFAGNLSSDEFIEAIDHAHLFSKKLYLTLNILIKDKEREEVDKMIEPLYRAGLDGVIVQDIGLISHLKKKYPLMEVHVSTQAFVTGPKGALLFKKMGASRVVPARELSIDEIKDIRKNAGIEVECFIHGAMCYCYSGMCLMSSFLGGRSGNRGRCAGPCRQPYGGKGKEDYILSMKDLCGIESIPDLIKAGVDSLKIEGRMKSPEYVYGVTSIYRKYIDLFYGKNTIKNTDLKKDMEKLVSIYSRSGLNPGYFNKRNGGEMITRERGSYSTSLPDIEKTDSIVRRASCRAVFKKGEEAVLSIRSGDNEAEVRGAVVEEAKKKPLSHDDILKQLKKCGNSGFYFEETEIIADPDIFIPVSVLNELRRRGLAELKEDILSEYRRSL